MAFYVQIDKDGNVTNVWGSPPADMTGWKEAVEVYPQVDPATECLDGHTFDVAATPAQIIWKKRALSPDEQKQTANNNTMQQITALERTQTPRRMREAIAGTDGGWLSALDTKIAALRAQLVK